MAVMAPSNQLTSVGRSAPLTLPNLEEVTFAVRGMEGLELAVWDQETARQVRAAFTLQEAQVVVDPELPEGQWEVRRA